MTLFDSPFTITLDGQPLDIIGTDTGSYVAADGRTWPFPVGVTEPATDAAGVQAHIEATRAAPPVVPVPATLTPRQLRQWLILNGKFDAVTAALAGIEDATQRALAQNWWDYSTLIERAHPLVAQIAAALGMTSADVDAAFIAAAQL